MSGLIHNSLNSATLGRYVVQIRNGALSGAFNVNAGLDRTVANPAVLNGIVTNTGGRSLTYLWTQTSGPADAVATIDQPTHLQTSVTFPYAGSYTFSLAVSDGQLVVIDKVVLTLDMGADAGPDQTVYTTAALTGTVTYPSGEALTYQWTQISGPGIATITQPYSYFGGATASFSAAGTYILQLTVLSGTLSSTDTVAITLLQEPTPIFSPDGGTFIGTVHITMTCANPSASIRYTIDGTDPTATTGTAYAGPVALTQSATVKARAFEVGGITSQQMSRAFNLSKVSAAMTTTSTAVSLSTLGTLDWIHWGDTTNFPTATNVKSGGGFKISNYTNIGTGVRTVYTNDSRSMSWTGGTPLASSTLNTKGVVCVDLAEGFQITAPADTTIRKLYVYVGGQSSAGTLTAKVTGSTSDDYTDIMTTVLGIPFDRNYILTYHGTATGQTLTVKWVMSQKGTGGQVRLSGAALSP